MKKKPNLIENILHKFYDLDFTSGNLIEQLSDDLSNLLIIK